MGSQKSVHSIVLDAGPLLRNDSSISTLLAACEELVTVPSLLPEIKDQAARSRVETMVLPFLTLRHPSLSSIKVIADFASKTGDLAVLSKTDIQLLALTYEVECERNGGDWRLRKAPGQKGINGPSPKKQSISISQAHCEDRNKILEPSKSGEFLAGTLSDAENLQGLVQDHDDSALEPVPDPDVAIDASQLTTRTNSFQDVDTFKTAKLDVPDRSEAASNILSSDSSDSGGWITPVNVRRHQASHANSSMERISERVKMQAAILTSDFAMQNVALAMGLNLISQSMQRVHKIKTYILRCHACFEKTKDLTRQFCARCGKPTLTRVSCSVGHDGKLTLHLKKNMQWNHRGDRFSIPKVVSGSASGKVKNVKGGGKGGWGQDLILAEDQKEYKRAIQGKSSSKNCNLWDNDCLPGILTGERKFGGFSPKIGGGRNINSKKR